MDNYQLFDGAKVYKTHLGDKEISIETGVLAAQAGGAVTVRCGDTVLFATATGSKETRPGIGFFPLTVDFEEKLYAAGRIPGSFFRREGRPSEQAILLCRLVDRPLRPLFPKGFRNDVQIIISSLSSDGQHLMDPLAIIAASAALAISDIPWDGPVGAASVGYVDGKFVVNPTAEDMTKSVLGLQVAGTEDNILMVEAGAHELPEDLMLEALNLAYESMQPVISTIKQMQAEIGKAKWDNYQIFLPSAELKKEVQALVGDAVREMVMEGPARADRKDRTHELEAQVKAHFAGRVESGEITPENLNEAFGGVVKEGMRRHVLDNNIRIDGRSPQEIRPISVQVGRIPRVHGSGFFIRGETHVLTIATLGTPGEAQQLDTLQPGEEKRYMHHYNFPPYSTGEAYPLRGPKRREIGHGALAERALLAVIPEDFPYTLRLVSEVMSSNGSTSMASVCASTLALMDAGVHIDAPVAGIAMGLIQDVNDASSYAVLSDILGTEDHLGDMDFKVAGSAHGITALQMDMKIQGLDFNILRQALQQAREGRMHILGKMLEVLAEPRSQMSEFAPRILTIHINPEKIGKIIGPGGKTIRAIQDEYKVKVDVNDDGTVFISGTDGVGAERAKREIESLTEDVEVGKIYTGQVVRTEPYGVFLNIIPGVDGLIHISQLADYRVGTVEEIAKVGDELTAMVIDVDPSGKVRLSRQAVLENWTAEEAHDRDRGGSRGGGGGGDRGGDRGGRGGDRGGRGGNGRRDR